MTRRAGFWMVALGLAVSAAAVQAAPLRYVSQRVDRAYMREGPSYNHRVMWIYRHRGYPFAVLAQFDIWRRVQAADGTVGWMSAQMLSDQRTVLIKGRDRVALHADPDQGSRLVAYAMPGATAKLEACSLRACRVSAPGLKGWADKSRLWGVGFNEVFK